MEGELSATRQANIGTGGNSTRTEKITHRALTNELKRPSVPRSSLPEWIKNNVAEPVALDGEEFAKNFRTSRRGAAPNLAGMSAEHLRPLLEHETAVRLGRMTVLQKRDGKVRGIVVGDYFRRLVPQTLAKQFAQGGGGRPRAGCECVAHMVQASRARCKRRNLWGLTISCQEQQ